MNSSIKPTRSLKVTRLNVCYLTTPTPHFGGSGKSLAQNYNLGGFRYPQRPRLQLPQCLRQGTEAQGHNGWLLAEADLRPRSSRLSTPSANRLRGFRSIPAAWETEQPGKRKKPQRQEPWTRRAGRSPTPASPGKSPPCSPGRWSRFGAHRGTGLGIENKRL